MNQVSSSSQQEDGLLEGITRLFIGSSSLASSSLGSCSGLGLSRKNDESTREKVKEEELMNEEESNSILYESSKNASSSSLIHSHVLLSAVMDWKQERRIQASTDFTSLSLSLFRVMNELYDIPITYI
jgi:hypothetical protein